MAHPSVFCADFDDIITRVVAQSNKTAFNDTSILEAYDRMLEALRIIAGQELETELGEDAQNADYQGAYETIVTLARSTLA